MVQVARFRVGQNLHQSRTTRPDAEDLAAEWVRAVEGWYSEVAQFPATEAAVTNYRFSPATGHYSQLVWAATTRLGCGLAQYREGRFVSRLLVCNYGEAGNLISAPVYRPGPACSRCPGLCSSLHPGLCAQTLPHSD